MQFLRENIASNPWKRLFLRESRTPNGNLECEMVVRSAFRPTPPLNGICRIPCSGWMDILSPICCIPCSGCTFRAPFVAFHVPDVHFERHFYVKTLYATHENTYFAWKYVNYNSFCRHFQNSRCFYNHIQKGLSTVMVPKSFKLVSLD